MARLTTMKRAGKRVTSTSLATDPGSSQPIELLLMKFRDVDQWQQDNEYLLGSYRPSSGSYRESFKSLFYLHNQTGNIYSHLLGVIFFLLCALPIFTTIVNYYTTVNIFDVLVFGAFITSAVTCFGFSAFFHLAGNHSSEVYHAWLLMDLYGIFILIVGTVFSGTYYGFYCDPLYWIIYSLGIVIIVTLAAFLCYWPQFRTPTWRWARAVMFCAIGWTGAFPMRHAATAFGIQQAHRQMGWWYFIAEGLSYIFGATIYAMRVPERLRPGAFDIWGSSHQLFHLFAVLGAALHLLGLIKAFNYNHDPLTRLCHV